MEKFNALDIATISNADLQIKDVAQNCGLVARQTFGLDFIFDKSGQVLCIEINGYMSGINGYRHVCNSDEYIKLRPYLKTFIDHVASSYALSKAKGVIFFSDLAIDIYRLTATNRILLRRFPSDLENIASHFFTDKLRQKSVIPETSRVNTLNVNELQSVPESERGNYLVKPRFAAYGDGIVSLDKLKGSAFSCLLRDKRFIIEHFVKSLPADFDKKRRFASMRLFTVCRFYFNHKDKNIYISPETVLAYQRVAEDPIVNISRGAKAVPASRREFERAWKVSRRIISNISNKILKVRSSRFIS